MTLMKCDQCKKPLTHNDPVWTTGRATGPGTRGAVFCSAEHRDEWRAEVAKLGLPRQPATSIQPGDPRHPEYLANQHRLDEWHKEKRELTGTRATHAIIDDPSDSTPWTLPEIRKALGESPERIFDNPNHPGYGPVRRMWVILNQLNLLTFLDHMYQSHSYNWDTELWGHINAHDQNESATFAYYLGIWLREWQLSPASTQAITSRRRT